jgi:hypothetical protein
MGCENEGLASVCIERLLEHQGHIPLVASRWGESGGKPQHSKIPGLMLFARETPE